MRLSLLLIATWVLASLFANPHALLLPDADTFAAELWRLVVAGDLAKHLLVTLGRVSAGVICAVVMGVPLGLLMGRSHIIRSELGPIVEFLRAIPTSMLFPVFIALFGLGETSKMMIALYLAMPVVIISAMTGALPRDESRGRDDYIRIHSHRIGRRHRVASVLWDARASIIGGIKIAISLSLVIVIVTEMFFVASAGVGWAAFKAYEGFRIDEMYAYIFVVGAVGLGLNKLFDSLIKTLDGHAELRP